MIQLNEPLEIIDYDVKKIWGTWTAYANHIGLKSGAAAKDYFKRNIKQINKLNKRLQSLGRSFDFETNEE